jgi:hypothetical protein
MDKGAGITALVNQQLAFCIGFEDELVDDQVKTRAR